jgi:glycosyltransferase involved in cell wall biosynthesis
LANARSVQTIHCPLDTQVFRPHDKREARRAWNLAEDDVVVAFGAASLSVRRKGMRELLEALVQLQDKQKIVLVVFGGGRHANCDQAVIDATVAAGREGMPRIRHVGFVDDPRQQSLLYSAADMLVVPSLEDNSPQTGIEALACGTPVVGFATGGIPDYVRPQQTGLLAQVGNATDLARQINWLMHHPQDGRRMGHNGRAVVEREFSQEATARQYVELYRRLLEEAQLEDPRQANRRRWAA